MATSKPPSRWSRFKGVVRRPLAGIKNPLPITKPIDPNPLALESLENRVLLSTIEFLVGPHVHHDHTDSMRGNGSSLDDTIIDLLDIDDNPKGIESPEPGVMKSATWLDADTGDPIAGATEGDDIFNAGGSRNDDIIYALGGDDILFGNNGDDILNGAAGDDEIHGGNHNDTLFGGTGDDVLYGDNHDDILVSGGGNDVMVGGHHDDTFQFTGAQHGDVITVDGGKHNDTIDLSEYSSSQVSDNGSTIIVDMGDEESFTINYSGIENILVAAVVISIDATDATAAEPDDDGLFTIFRTGDTLENLLVKYHLTGSAENGIDYALLDGTVTIPAGQDSVEVLLDVLDDAFVEDTEFATLTLLEDSAYTIAQASSETITILDDDGNGNGNSNGGGDGNGDGNGDGDGGGNGDGNGLPKLSIDATDPTATEPDDDGRFTITRVGSVLGDLLVWYDISGTAENGVDYAFLTGSIVIPDGLDSIVVPIDVINDPIGEGSEFVSITILEDPAYIVTPADSAQVTIDDEGLVLPFGQAPGLVRKVVFRNDEGTLATVKAAGLTGTLFFDGDSVTTRVMKKTIFVQGVNLSIEKILLETTSDRSALTVKTKGINHPTIDIDEILVTGSLRKLNAKSVNVTEGIHVEGALGLLRVGAFAPNTYLTTHAGSFRPLRIIVASIGPDSVLDLTGKVSLLKAGSFPSGLLTADSLKRVVIKDGPFAPDVLARTGSITSIRVAGDISGDIFAQGSIRSVFSKTGSIDADILAKTGDISAIRARGLIAGSIVANGNIQRVITRTGDLTAAVRAGKNITTLRAVNLDSAIISAGANIGRVTIKENIIDSYILAGYDIGPDAAFGLQGPHGFDKVGSGNIKAVTAGGQFVASYIAAGVLPLTPLTADILPDMALPFAATFGSIGRVRFGSIELDNEFEFGLFAASDIGPLFLDNQSLDEITDPFVTRVLNP